MRGFYCLEADRADGRPLGGGRGAKVIFELSDTLTDLSRVPAPGEVLFPGYAKALLTEIPQVDSSSREFRNAVSVQVTLLRQFDGIVGHYGQLWDLSGDAARLVFSGQVTAQGVGVGDTRLTLSDLPVDSINAEVPARTVEAENFPGTRDAGATVPVVIGRALRHPCPHLSSGYEFKLEQTAVGSTLGIAWDSGVAVPSAATTPDGIAAIDANTWLLADSATDKIYTTTDGGATWDSGVRVPSAALFINGITTINATTWLIADTTTEKIYKTTNSGATWNSGVRFPSSVLYARGIAATDANTWLLADGTKIYTTTDGGATWDSGIALPSGATSPGGIAAIDANTWLLADGTKVYKTTDGGATWDSGTALPSGATSPGGIAAIDANTWLLADRTTDKTYRREASPVPGDKTLTFKHDKLDQAALKKYFPVAIGDMLSVGIGEVDSNNASLTETVRVKAVDLSGTNPSVTLEKGLENTHTVTAASGNNPAVDVVVVNHSVVRDYLLGEGVAEDPADSTREINFRRAYRAYQDGRALPFHEVDESGVLLKFSATPGSGVVTLAVDNSGINTNSDPLFGYAFNYSYRAEGVALTDSAAVPGDGRVTGLINDKEYSFSLIASKASSPTFYAVLAVTPSATDTTTVNGQALVPLPANLTAPLDDWYRGFVVELTEDTQADPETRALRVESYQVQVAPVLPANSIHVQAPSGNFRFSNYSMREYRFFDGSQTSPYPGFAFMRFAVKYDGEIRADVQGFALEKPQEFIKELLRNETWGAKETGTFHLPAATDPQPPAPVKLEMSLTSATNAYSILDQSARVRPFHLFRRPDGVHLTFPEGLTPSKHLLPAIARCPSPPPSLEYMTQADQATRLAVKFRPDPLTREFKGTLAEMGTDAPRRIELPYAYDAETARQCLWFERALLDSRRRVMRIAVLGGEWRVGDVVKESEPLLGATAGKWRVFEAQERVGVVQTLVLGWLEDADADVFSWAPSDDNWPLAGWDKDIRIGDPATDWSKTPPPPIYGLKELLTVRDSDTTHCEISLAWKYAGPLDNVSGVQIEAVTGDVPEVFTIRREVERGESQSGVTTIEVAECEVDATVRVYSLSPHNNLRGFPATLTLSLAARYIHVATSSSALTSEPSVTSVSFSSGSTRTLYVKLPQKPTQSVTVRITKTGVVGISKTTMTFSTSKWGVAQSVSLSGSAGSGTVVFTATSSDANYDDKTHTVPVTIGSPPLPKLPTPSTPVFDAPVENYIEGNFIWTYLRASYGKVSNATSYLIDLRRPSAAGGNLVYSYAYTKKVALFFRVGDPSITPSLPEVPHGTYSIRVKATASGYRDSYWTPRVSYTVS